MAIVDEPYESQDAHEGSEDIMHPMQKLEYEKQKAERRAEISEEIAGDYKQMLERAVKFLTEEQKDRVFYGYEDLEIAERLM